ncbi:hemolysin family protein [Calidifontibacter indicus]|uniref:hemolysin family protein n=1 Tax=Calidifontibacter indicus TaxID=419650 RepID=UPI003D723576
MSTPAVIVATIAIIVLSAFFVAIEFSLMAARRHRLEERAGESRSARAALRSSGELTLLLAGSQLGITMCTLALGAITKPAVHHWLMAPLEHAGLPQTATDVVAFVLALIVVTFLHLVIGEMAPKSWAIAHPETSAIMLALPMRGFMFLTRPILRLLNEAANRLVRRSGVEPVDELTVAGDPQALRALVEHSANVGALELGYRASITRALVLEEITVGDLLRPGAQVTAVSGSATVRDVQEATRRSGHLRVLLRDGDQVRGFVHVRDTLVGMAPDDFAGTLLRPVVELQRDTPLHEAIATMRETSTQLAVVRHGAHLAGVVTFTDILPSLFPRGVESA